MGEKERKEIIIFDYTLYMQCASNFKSTILVFVTQYMQFRIQSYQKNYS